MDGAVYEWKLKDLKREKENVLKQCNYACVLATPDTRSIFAVGSDKKLKVCTPLHCNDHVVGACTQWLRVVQEFDDVQISKDIDTGVCLTQICLPPGGRSLFAAA